MVEDLGALNAWVSLNFPSLEVKERRDGCGGAFLSVTSRSCHPVLMTLPSVQLNIFVQENLLVSKLVAFNLLPLREVSSTIEEEMNGEGKMKEILRLLSGQQTSVCVGIPEENVKARGLVEFLGLVMIERFLNCVVVRSRGCSRVMLEQEGMFLCHSCLELKQKLDNVTGNGELELSKIEDKFEKNEEFHVDVKMEPEVQVNDGSLDDDYVPSFFKSEPMKHVSKQLKTKLKCPDDNCKRKFGKYKALVKHCQEAHQYFDENLAAKLSQVKIELEAKPRKFRSDNDASAPNQCPECERCYWSHKSLVKHCNEHHNMPRDQIPKAKKSQSNSDAHIPERFSCDFCPKMFKFQSSVINHTKRYHTETKMIPCEHCGKEVKQSNMDMHFKNNHATPRFTCNQCGKAFYFKALMVNHIAVMHEGQKNHICDLCGAKFGIKKSLERHVRCQHEDYRPHVCEYCQKAFHTLQKLQKHISGHIKDKLYVCPVCDAKFYYQDNVKMHIKKSHPDQDAKMKCRIIDNPDYVPGQEVYAMDSGRRMRVNNSKLSSGCRTDYRSASGSSLYDNNYNIQPGSSSQSPSGSGYGSQLFQDATPRDEEQDGETSQNEIHENHQQFLDQPRHDLSNYLLNLRYANYANHYNQ